LSDEILAATRPARETFPELAAASALEAFKAKGRGYQTRMAAGLKNTLSNLEIPKSYLRVTQQFRYSINSLRGQTPTALRS